eukprot:CAMPEP_0194763190 /NCGR_PEP_ID=MMETSP0323_2-20130528/18443_1 /TAXON_ID=2866 ORGANISM="Crypthecodinium cohnii, Strain Seligo" /NCGR_SAMPLE_ID=MMETSP0323_2 /ASSEMBLY_ACC=CAM_ASM_000346 /LENGTH=39 /DNA_ID= /DNA_START= /DNA_END= /DNA_ORIENTATION=
MVPFKFGPLGVMLEPMPRPDRTEPNRPPSPKVARENPAT